MTTTPPNSNYLVSEEDAIVVVALFWVNPGVADEVDGAFAGNVFESDGLEEELSGVVVGDDDSSRNSNGFLMIEVNSVS